MASNQSCSVSWQAWIMARVYSTVSCSQTKHHALISISTNIDAGTTQFSVTVCKCNFHHELLIKKSSINLNSWLFHLWTCHKMEQTRQFYYSGRKCYCLMFLSCGYKCSQAFTTCRLSMPSCESLLLPSRWIFYSHGCLYKMNSKSSVYIAAKAEPGSGVWIESWLCSCVGIGMGMGRGMEAPVSEGFWQKALGYDVTDNLWLILIQMFKLNTFNMSKKPNDESLCIYQEIQQLAAK